MKRKISLFLVLVCAFWSCAGALADGFLSPGSSEVTAAFDAAGLKYSQLDISNSGDVFRISYAPATSTQLDSIVVTIHGHGEQRDRSGALHRRHRRLGHALALSGPRKPQRLRLLYPLHIRYDRQLHLFQRGDSLSRECGFSVRCVERYAYITALVVDQLLQRACRAEKVSGL